MIRLFHPQRPALRLAIVSVQAGPDGQAHVSVARGASRYALTDSRLYGPFAAGDAEARVAEQVEALRGDGYLPAGIAAMLETVASGGRPRDRAHAAERLGWRREREAVAALRARAAQPKDDITSVTVALGRIGDLTAAPDLRAEAERKLLSRRRAGSEAVRLLGDAEGTADVVKRARARLAEDTLSIDSSVDELTTQLAALPFKRRGPALDALYDTGADHAAAAVRAHLRSASVGLPGLWRFVKSILKRAMLRDDGPTFGLIMALVERQGRTAKGGTTASLKSGLDGETRATRVFSQRTADWLRRAAWRHLTRVARYRADDYVAMATDVLLEVRATDDLVPRHRVPAAGHCYLLMRICTSGGGRFAVDRRRPTHRLKKGQPASAPTTTEEAFAALWAEPAAIPHVRRLLAAADHRHAIVLALRLAEQTPAIVDDADAATLVACLRHPSLVERATGLLRKRLARVPLDTDAILALAAADSDAARALVATVVQDTAHLWTNDPAVAVALLLAPPVVREAAVRMVRAAAPSMTAAVRRALATRLVDAVDRDAVVSDDGAFADGAFDGVVEVIDVFADDIRAVCDVDRARALLTRHASGAAVAALVIGWHPEALAMLGIPEVLRLAAHSQAAYRAVVTAMMAKTPETFARLPGLVLELVEGEWDDVRDAGIVILGIIETKAGDVGDTDTATVLAICDSTWPAVQAVGTRAVRRLVLADHPASPTLVASLAQHPHPAMRGFVLDLAEGVVGAGLRPGLVPLLRLEPLLRAALFEVRPQTVLRRRVLQLLATRGIADEAQGELSAQILKDIVRSRTHAMRDDALAALVALAAAWPSVRALLADDGIVVDVGDVGAPVVGGAS